MSKLLSNIQDEFNSISTYLGDLGILFHIQFPIEKKYPSYQTYGGEIKDVSSDFDYHLRLIDGSKFKFYYKYNNNKVLISRLEYQNSELTETFLDMVISNELWTDDFFDDFDDEQHEIEEFIVNKYIYKNTRENISERFANTIGKSLSLRFDYDNRVDELNHPGNHLTINNITESRLCVDQNMYPTIFVSFILRCIYGLEVDFEFNRKFMNETTTLIKHKFALITNSKNLIRTT